MDASWPTPALLDSIVTAIGATGADGDPEARFQRAAWTALAADPATATRAGTPGHFTASALPVDPTSARVCLVLHGKINLWVQPGGHLEPGDDTVTAAALRELEEETGLAGHIDPTPVALSRHRAPCRRDDWHLDLEFLVTVEEAAPIVSDESHDVAWFAPDGLPSNLAPGVAELVSAARTHLLAGRDDVAPATS